MLLNTNAQYILILRTTFFGLYAQRFPFKHTAKPCPQLLWNTHHTFKAYSRSLSGQLLFVVHACRYFFAYPERLHLKSFKMAGLLTRYLITNTFPSFSTLSGICLCLRRQHTAAGLFGIRTQFPISRFREPFDAAKVKIIIELQRENTKNIQKRHFFFYWIISTASTTSFILCNYKETTVKKTSIYLTYCIKNINKHTTFANYTCYFQIKMLYLQ